MTPNTKENLMAVHLVASDDQIKPN